MKSKKCSKDEILSCIGGRCLLRSVTHGFACTFVPCCFLWHQSKVRWDSKQKQWIILWVNKKIIKTTERKLRLRSELVRGKGRFPEAQHCGWLCVWWLPFSALQAHQQGFPFCLHSEFAGGYGTILEKKGFGLKWEWWDFMGWPVALGVLVLGLSK